MLAREDKDKATIHCPAKFLENWRGGLPAFLGEDEVVAHMEGELPRILVGEKTETRCESKPRRQRGKDASIVVGKRQGKLVAKESS